MGRNFESGAKEMPDVYLPSDIGLLMAKTGCDTL
jgi:hypothetical protein